MNRKLAISLLLIGLAVAISLAAIKLQPKKVKLEPTIVTFWENLWKLGG